jgi:L-fuculose-phosphate aldolase
MIRIKQVQTEIIAVGRKMIESGLVTGSWGNISVRIDEDTIAITPSGRNYLSLQADDIVLVSQAGNTLAGVLKPSSELPLHLAVYQSRRDIQAIVHTHSVFASACAVAHKAIAPIIEDLVQVVGGSVDVAPYALPGTTELAENAVKSLGNKNAVLLANHGVLGCGATLQEALLCCELVEKAAQIFIYAQSIGGAVALSEADVLVMHEFYSEHYRYRQGGTEDV